MKKMHLSWSILYAWSCGKRDEAVEMLMKQEIEQIPEMKEGKRIHKKIADGKLKLLPFIKDSAIFEDVDPEKNRFVNYFKVDVFDWLSMGMIADVLDVKEGLLVDWKSGNSKSNQYNKLQIYIYAYLLNKLEKSIKIKDGVIAKVYEDSSGAILSEDFCIYKITDEKLEFAENYIESNASEIFTYLGFDNEG